LFKLLGRKSATDANPTSHDEAPTFRSLSDRILSKKDSVFFLGGGGGCSRIGLALVSSCGGAAPCIHHVGTVCGLRHGCFILSEIPLAAIG
jgi:hypothetical protein